ncbi:MAG TPA: glycosyltransferase [Gemmataceae bacterium]|nr:glycosyltransferase [Gemmataceae bacterium]
MHVVIVDGDVSYPPSSGKRLRTLHLMLRLAERHRIAYIARAHNGAGEIHQAAAFLRDHGIEPILLDDPLPHKNGLGFYARLAGNLLSPLPYSAASHRSRRMRDALQRYAAEHAVDLWQFEWTPYVGTLGANRETRRLLIAHNVDSLIWQRYHKNERHILKRFYIHKQWRKFERFERRVFAEVDHIVAVSSEDANLLRRQFAVENLDVIENGVDTAYFENVRGGGKAGVILFLGSLDWRPNLDAVRLLLDDIFPVVRQAEPAARLCLVGRNPPDWLLQRVAQAPNVDLHSNVPDVRPYLAESGVMAVPLRIGGGSRLKILEALACRLPVVSTRIGAEGLNLQPDRDLIVVERVEDMAAALIESIRSPERVRRMADQARELVRENYDWAILAAKLERVWERCVHSEKRKRREGEACVSSN